MNRDEWDKMTPEQRNKLIAVKIMGWDANAPCTGTFIPLNPEPDGLYCPKCNAQISWGDLRDGEHLHDAPLPPRYSQDMNAAWQIVEKMTARMTWQNPNFKWRGPIYKPEYEYMTQDGYPLDTTCWYVYLEMDGLRQWVCASKAIDAICLAGLKVVEQDKVLSQNNTP